MKAGQRINREFEKLLLRIKIYRAGKNLTQSSLAKQLGLSLRTYQRIEQGIAPLDIYYLYKLSEIFQIPYKEMAGPYYGENELEDTIPLKNFPNSHGLGTNIPSISEEVTEKFLKLKNEVMEYLDQPNTSISDILKVHLFKNHEFPLYVCDSKWSYSNKSLTKNFDPTQKAKSSVVRNLADFKYVIKIWEYFYDNPDQFFIAAPVVNRGPHDTVKVTSLNYFTLYEGFPLVLGTILSTTPIQD